MLAVAWLLHAPVWRRRQKAPTTKTVSGVVTDKAENGINGATVTLKDLQTGKTVAIYTEANGQYQFSDLDPHHDYEIQASFKGVSSETRQVQLPRYSHEAGYKPDHPPARLLGSSQIASLVVPERGEDVTGTITGSARGTISIVAGSSCMNSPSPKSSRREVVLKETLGA